jgi:uncharacterized protein YeaO (DUF488 family)
MVIKLSEYSYGSPRSRGEGLRIGSARYLPRGVRTKSYARQNLMDVWLPILAPSRKLINWAKKTQLSDKERWKTFVRRYQNEMKDTMPRQTIRTLGKLAKQTPIAVGCYCQGDQCHRFVLERLIRKAAIGRF